jgi:hypothetical protein
VAEAIARGDRLKLYQTSPPKKRASTSLLMQHPLVVGMT